MRTNNPMKYLKKLLAGSGMHIHHITPVYIARRNGWTEDQINDWSNLSILSSDDHKQLHIELANDNPEETGLVLAAKVFVLPEDKLRSIQSYAGKIAGEIAVNSGQWSEALLLGGPASVKSRQESGVMKQQMDKRRAKAHAKWISTATGKVLSKVHTTNWNKTHPECIGTWVPL